MKRWLFRLALLALGIVVALVALELFLRIADPGHYGELEEREAFSERVLRRDPDGVLRLRPGVDTTFLGERVTISALGLRNPPVALPKPADVYRIVVVGDSVPFGWGVGEDEAFPRRLERELQRQPRADGRRYEVVNAGVPGFGLVEEYVWLRDHGLAMTPDLVLHCVIANDVEAPPGMPKLILSPALRRVRTLRLVERLVEKIGGIGPVDPAGGVTPQQLVFSIDRFVELCRPVGARYVLMDTIAVPEAVRHCQERGIDRADCFISVAWIDAHRVRPTDFHPNADGHAWMAERVLPVVRQVAER